MVRGELNIDFQEVRATSYGYGIGNEKKTVHEIAFISDNGSTFILSFPDGSFEKIAEAIEKYDMWN